jgi:two-component system chemotaxis sensor kinase CheA
VFDTEEIVVKPVAPILRHVSMFSGNTILGDGSVIMILDPNGIARATGVGGGESQRREAAVTARAASEEKSAVLLFRGGGEGMRAVPLGLVARLENIERAAVETSSGKPVTQYRGKLMPLVAMAGAIDPERSQYPVLVFADGERCMGLVVDEIVDVVEDHLRIELAGARDGLLGTAVVAGRATDVIDIGHYLTLAFQDWFAGRTATTPGRASVLIVDDSDFFRQMLVATLAASGLQVTSVASAAQALKLRDGGQMFDAIVSDIDMPDIDGLGFVRQLRAGGAWAGLPVIALTGHASPEAVARGREAGFTDYVAKFERDAVLVSLRQCLAQRDTVAFSLAA